MFSAHVKKRELRFLYYALRLSPNTYLAEVLRDKNLRVDRVSVRRGALSCNDTFEFLSSKQKGL